MENGVGGAEFQQGSFLLIIYEEINKVEIQQEQVGKC
jgi:hypothetical protein